MVEANLLLFDSFVIYFALQLIRHIQLKVFDCEISSLGKNNQNKRPLGIKTKSVFSDFTGRQFFLKWVMKRYVFCEKRLVCGEVTVATGLSTAELSRVHIESTKRLALFKMLLTSR